MEVPKLSGVLSPSSPFNGFTSLLNVESLSLSEPKNRFLTDPAFYHLADCSILVYSPVAPLLKSHRRKEMKAQPPSGETKFNVPCPLFQIQNLLATIPVVPSRNQEVLGSIPGTIFFIFPPLRSNDAARRCEEFFTLRSNDTCRAAARSGVQRRVGAQQR